MERDGADKPTDGHHVRMATHDRGYKKGSKLLTPTRKRDGCRLILQHSSCKDDNKPRLGLALSVYGLVLSILPPPPSLNPFDQNQSDKDDIFSWFLPPHPL
jgi:hypothetical protein